MRLLSAGPGRDVTKYAAGAIANLTFDSDENCAAVLAANGVAPLAALLRAALEPGGSGATDATSFAIDALRNLSRCNDAARDAAREAGALPLLVALLGPPGAAPTPLTRAAAGALRNLAANNDTNRAAIRAAGGIEPLVALLKTDPSAEVTAHAAAALRNLARGNAQNRDAMREAGAIAPLVALLGAGPKNEATSHACAALANLTFDNALNQDAVRDAGGVRPLMALLGTSSDLTTYATGALANGACVDMPRFMMRLLPLTRFPAQWRTRWWRCRACCTTRACRWPACCARRSARLLWRSLLPLPPRPPRRERGAAHGKHVYHQTRLVSSMPSLAPPHSAGPDVHGAPRPVFLWPKRL